MGIRRPTIPALLLLLGAFALVGCQSQSSPSTPSPPMPPSAPSPSSPSPSPPTPPSGSPSQPSSQSPAGPQAPQSGQQTPQPGQQQPAGAPSPGGDTSPSTGSTDAGAAPGDSGAGTADSDADGSASGDQGTAAGAGVDDDGVLAQAVEVFRRSAARSRSAEAPADGDEGVAGDTADARAPGSAAGGADDDLDDLISGELDDLIAGGGQTGRGREPAEGTEGMSGDMDGDGAEAGPWHQPGAAGRGQDPSPEEVYGDASGSGAQSGDEGEAGGTQTAAERHAELERVLAEAMGDFDGRILDERAVIVARRGNEPGTIEGAGHQDDGGAGAADQRGGRDTAGRRPVPPPPAPSGEERPDGQTGTAGTSGSVGGGEVLPVPDDVGDGADDDVVARQLREAAMAETDPELREKLWDEYRRYVAGRR